MQPSVHPSSPCTALHPPLHATRADLYGNLFFAAISDEDYIEDIENISCEKLVALKPGGDAAQICADVGLREVTTKKVLDEIRRMKLED